MDIRKNFSKRLKELRLDNNLTQVQLGEKTGISQTSLAKWENAERSPSIEYVAQLALFFNCTIEYLIGLSD